MVCNLMPDQKVKSEVTVLVLLVATTATACTCCHFKLDNVAVSVDALNTSIYSQYIAQLFPNNAQVLRYPDYSRYYASIFATPLLLF